MWFQVVLGLANGLAAVAQGLGVFAGGVSEFGGMAAALGVATALPFLMMAGFCLRMPTRQGWNWALGSMVLLGLAQLFPLLMALSMVRTGGVGMALVLLNLGYLLWWIQQWVDPRVIIKATK